MHNSDDPGQDGASGEPDQLDAATTERPEATAKEALRRRARTALRDAEFDLAERIIAAGDPKQEALIENLRIYQAELEIQNEELRRSERQAETALTRFMAFFNNLPIAELIVDANGLVVEANPEARSLLGLRDTRSHQYFLARLMSEDSRGEVIRAWQRLAEQQATDLLEVRFQPADGSSLIADLHIARLPSPEDGETRFVCAVVDRTESMRQREALRNAYDRLEASEERYRVLADFSPEWDYWLGIDGLFVHVSPACQDTTGYSSMEFISNPDLLEEIIHCDDLPLWQAHLREPLDGDRDHAPLQFRIRTRDGQERWIEHVCGPVLSEDGRNLGRRGVNRDVTLRQKAQEALRRSEALLDATGRLARVGGWEFVPSTNTLSWSLVTRELHEVDDNFEPDIHNALAFYRPRDQEVLRAAVEHALVDGTAYEFELQLRTAKGREIWVKTNGKRVTYQGGEHGLRGSIQDVSARIEAECAAQEREVQARTVFENTSEGIIITDPERRILAVNRAFTEITGYSEQEALGETPSLLQSGRHDEAFYQAMWATLEATGQWRGEFWNRRSNGDIYPQLSTISAVQDQAGRLTHYIAVFGDITQLKRSEEELYRLAHQDALTGLPNRALLRARLEQSISRAQREGSMLALLFLDLDLFKSVNDTLGHPVGDALLQSVATAMATKVRAADSIARLGGDEFVVLMETIEEPNVAAQLSRRLLDVFAHPFDAGGRELYITASIGISIFPMDGQDMDALLSNADVAMYQAKEHGRNTYRFFESAMTQGAMERLRLENALRGAMARNELRLVFQPQVKLTSGCMYGAEVLLRWHHGDLGDVSPGQFIPIAEELGLICEIGNWVLEEACLQLAEWDRKGFLVPRLAVNLSVQQLERGDLLHSVQAILARTNIAGDRLEMEVTESMLMRHAEQVISNLNALRDLGVTIAVDDFGSGFSSLSQLKTLPINRLKIDKAFVDNLTLDPNDDAIARTVIALGRGLGLDVLAEGVETEAQAEFLRQEHCSEAQGYLFGRPMTSAKLMDLDRRR